jgi:hypothetical protein
MASGLHPLGETTQGVKTMTNQQTTTLQDLIAKHREIHAAYIATKEPDDEPLGQQVDELEDEISAFPVQTLQDSAIKARFLFERKQCHPYHDGKRTTDSEELMTDDGAFLVIVEDAERLAGLTSPATPTGKLQEQNTTAAPAISFDVLAADLRNAVEGYQATCDRVENEDSEAARRRELANEIFERRKNGLAALLSCITAESAPHAALQIALAIWHVDVVIQEIHGGNVDDEPLLSVERLLHSTLAWLLRAGGAVDTATLEFFANPGDLSPFRGMDKAPRDTAKEIG